MNIAIAALALITSLVLGADVPFAVNDQVAKDQLRCRILADVARQLGRGRFDPIVSTGSTAPHGSVNCSAAFAASGVPMIPAGSSSDLNANMSAVGWKFSGLEFRDNDNATVSADYMCPLCGEGLTLYLKRESDHWNIIDQEMGWIS